MLIKSSIFVLIIIIFVSRAEILQDLVEDDNCTTKRDAPSPSSPRLLCPNSPHLNADPIYSSYEDSFPEKECTKCALRMNDDRNAVFVRCFRCQNMFKPPTLVETDKCVKIGDAVKNI